MAGQAGMTTGVLQTALISTPKAGAARIMKSLDHLTLTVRTIDTLTSQEYNDFGNTQDYGGCFDWDTYLSEIDSVAAPEGLFTAVSVSQ